MAKNSYNIRYESERQKLLDDILDQQIAQEKKWLKKFGNNPEGRRRVRKLSSAFTVSIDYPTYHKTGKHFSGYRTFKDLRSFEHFLLGTGRGPSGAGINFGPEGGGKSFFGSENVSIRIGLFDKKGTRVTGEQVYWESKLYSEDLLSEETDNEEDE